jgi:hypothetical protein
MPMWRVKEGMATYVLLPLQLKVAAGEVALRPLFSSPIVEISSRRRTETEKVQAAPSEQGRGGDIGVPVPTQNVRSYRRLPNEGKPPDDALTLPFASMPRK